MRKSIWAVLLALVMVSGCESPPTTAPSWELPVLRDPGNVELNLERVTFAGCPGALWVEVTRLLPARGSSTPTLPSGLAGPVCDGPNKACFEIEYKGGSDDVANRDPRWRFNGAFSTDGKTPDQDRIVIHARTFDQRENVNHWLFFSQGRVPKAILFWVFESDNDEWGNRLCQATLPLDYTER